MTLSGGFRSAEFEKGSKIFGFDPFSILELDQFAALLRGFRMSVRHQWSHVGLNEGTDSRMASS